MKVLVMRLSSIGDVLLTTPVVRCLKQQVPDAEVHFLTRGANGELLKGNPNIDKLLLLQESMDESVAMLKRVSPLRTVWVALPPLPLDLLEEDVLLALPLTRSRWPA